MSFPAQRIKLACLMLVACLVSPCILASNASTALSALEIEMGTQQKKELGLDYPLSNLYLEDSGVIWLVGSKNLWRWVPHLKKLSRIRIENKNTAKFLSSVFTEREIYILSTESVTLIEQSSATVQTIKLPRDYKSARQLSGVSANSFWVIGKDGHHLKYSFPLQQWQKFKPVPQQKFDYAEIDTDSEVLWLANGGQLTTIELNSNSVKVILDAKHAIYDLKIQDAAVVAHTPYALIRYDLAGKLMQVIPVKGKRRLLKMDLNKDTHAYLFSDRLLETYKMTEKKLERYRLNFEKAKFAQSFQTAKNSVALLIDGKPRYFELAKAAL
jgi:uncharacterized protein YkvS